MNVHICVVNVQDNAESNLICVNLAFDFNKIYAALKGCILLISKLKPFQTKQTLIYGKYLQIFITKK